MPLRIPDQTTFKCRSCQKTCTCSPRKDRHLLPWLRGLPIFPNGTCRHCGGESWDLMIEYIEHSTDLDLSPSGLAVSVSTLSVKYQRSTSSASYTFENIPAEAIARINANPKMRSVAVAKLVGALQLTNDIENGAKHCAVCKVRYFPQETIRWHQQNCCSKACLVKLHGQEALRQDASGLVEVSDDSLEFTPNNKRNVTCPDGHTFDVPAAFQGLKRPCPKCGASVLIP